MTSLVFILSGAAAALAAMIAWSRIFGFRAQRPRDYRGTSPIFDMRQYLNGALVCEGVIYGPTGRVASRFVADMEARWVGNTGVMTERFHYDSGRVQDREWTLTLGNDGSIRATAPDVVGAGRGAAEGSTVSLGYRIRLPKEAGGHLLTVSDWMYLMENGTIINRSQFRKFGLTVAELVATIRRKAA